MAIELPIPHAERYGQGTVARAPFPNHIDVRLLTPLLGVTIVRIAREHWPPAKRDGASWRVGESVDSLFIYDVESAFFDDKTLKPEGHGFASIVWGRPADNPWDSGHSSYPIAGNTVTGLVHQMAGYDTVVVRFGRHDPSVLLEGYLHRSQIPFGAAGTPPPPLYELAPVHMRLRARITHVDGRRCKVELSVSEYLAHRAGTHGDDVPDVGVALTPTPYVRLIEDRSEVASVGHYLAEYHPKRETNGLAQGQRWQGQRVLLIDDDKSYLGTLGPWLRNFGADVLEADNVQHARQVLEAQQTTLTHVLVDVHLGTRQDMKALIPELQRQQRVSEIGMMTGMLEDDVLVQVRHLRSEKYGGRLPLFAKPLAFGLLDRWLLQREPPADPTAARPADHWRQPGSGISQDMSRRARGWLQAMCHAVSAQSALWVRCTRPGYEIKAHFGLANPPDAEDIAARLAALSNDLSRTLVADVESTGQATRSHRAVEGPLRSLYHDGIQHSTAFPLTRRHHAPLPVNDVILLLSKSAIQPELFVGSQRLDELQMWWQDIQELEFLIDRLQEDAVFATLGRVHAATLHELRPSLQTFRGPKPWLAAEALAWWPHGVKALKLVDGGLYNIRAERVPEVLLRERLEALMDQFIWVFAQRRMVPVLVYLPPPSLKVTLPPEVFEQTLINLVDNATKSCQKAPGAWVTVWIREDATSDAHRPLVITVDDQGEGMTPDQVRKLFKPRETQRGAGGFGMGLYVSQRLAQAVGGELKLVRNERWAGCTFELRLPLSLGALAGQSQESRGRV